MLRRGIRRKNPWDFHFQYWRDRCEVRLLDEECGQSDAVVPQEILMGALKACSSGAVKELESGKRIHCDLLDSDCCSTISVANTLINMYAKCGSLGHAKAVFDAMPYHTIISWNALVLAFALNAQGELALDAISKLQQEGLAPNARTFVAGLRACASLGSGADVEREKDRKIASSTMIKSLEKGMALHSQIIGGGFLSDIFVGNSLVDMYAKLGSVIDSRMVFDTMPARDVVSWTALIAGYAENDEEEVALSLFSTMKAEGCVPNARTYVAVLTAWSVSAEKNGKLLAKSLQKGMEVHSQAIEDGCDSDIFVASSLVNMYAKCGNLREARKVFDKMPQRDVVAWTSLILGYAENGEGELALGLFQEMLARGCQPNARTYVAALMACASLAVREAGLQVDGNFVKVECLKRGMALHSEVAKKLFDSEAFVTNTLVDMYSKCGSLMDARRVFDRMPDHDAVSWSTLILGYADNGEDEVAVELFGRMRCEGCVPSAWTFVSVLVAASNLASSATSKEETRSRSLAIGMEVHALAAQSKCDSDIFVANTLIDLYVKCGRLASAREVFDKMPDRDAISWNALILGYAENDQDELALELFSKMIQLGQCEPTGRTFVAALQACVGLATKQESRGLGNEKLVKAGCLEKVMEIHSRATSSSQDSWDIFVESAVINAYAKCGSVLDARRAFDEMELQDVVAWTALILGYVESGEPDLGLELFSRMSSSDSCPSPNSRTFAAALMATSNIARLDSAKALHSAICRRGIETDSLVASCLIDAYGKSGSVGGAESVFAAVATRDPMLWSALVSVHSSHGDCARALSIFRDMLRESVSANGVTFLSVLAACGRAGMVDQGLRLFHAMGRSYGVVPGIEHCHCVVDMLGRANRLEEALRVVETMPYEPTVVTWTAVLAACATWRNVVIGRIAYVALLKLDATQAATYALMAKLETAACA